MASHCLRAQTELGITILKGTVLVIATVSFIGADPSSDDFPVCMIEKEYEPRWLIRVG